jgi:hypothetical protein
MTAPVCFVAGTHIRTRRGEVRVEDLRVGDHAITPDGNAAFIKWVGKRFIPAYIVQQSSELRPIRIVRDAFSEGVPARDLLVSNGHSVHVDGALIPTGCLHNGATIAQENGAARDVTYFHVELERHGLLLSEGLAMESYLDVDNRSFFSNSPEITQLRPVLPEELHTSRARCLPLVFEGSLVQKVRHHLIGRAKHLGFEMTDDPSMSILVNGRSLTASSIEGQLWRFSLPEGTREVRILSRSSMPQSGDRRTLGLAICRVSLRRPDHIEEIELDDHRLTDGFHELERFDGRAWRWTTGEARLKFPTPLDRCELGLLVHGHRYWIRYSNQRVSNRA